MVEYSLWYLLVRYDNLFMPKAFHCFEFWRISTLLNWLLNGERIESSFCASIQSLGLAHVLSQICRKCSRSVLSDKMPNIIDILPGPIQQGFSTLKNNLSGAARLLVENKDSPLPRLQDTTGIFKDNLKSATPTNHTSRLQYRGSKESMQISTRSKSYVEKTFTMLSTYRPHQQFYKVITGKKHLLLSDSEDTRRWHSCSGIMLLRESQSSSWDAWWFSNKLTKLLVYKYIVYHLLCHLRYDH